MANPASPDGEAPAIEVHGLLVCRGVGEGADRHVVVNGVLDIVPVAGYPGEAGPLAFVAFVRAWRAGEAAVSFRVHPVDHPDVTLASFPGRLSIAKGYEGRQTVVRVEVKSLQVKQGGWFGVEFRLGETVLARNRFLIGAVAPRPGAAPTPSSQAGTPPT
jgi:hypothetical protein